MKYTFLIYFLLLSASTLAQQPDYLLKENNVWTFGSGSILFPPDQGTGLNFDAGSPPAVISNVAPGVAGEAQASVCDNSGNLLFYTDGSYILDRNNNLMPHGDTLVGDTALYDQVSSSGFEEDLTTATSQGVVIVPVINNPNRYYVLSLTSPDFYTGNVNPHVSKGTGGELFYSVVDMTLNNGLGDVLTSQRGIFIDSNLTGGMVAVAGTHCDIWILVHAINEPVIYAFNVNANGINPTPIVSHCGNFDIHYLGLGAIKVSPDRKKLAICSIYTYLTLNYTGGAEICDFDPATGIVSNAITLTNQSTYQACFSPDNSKLYLACFYIQQPSDIVFQYNLTNNMAVTQITHDTGVTSEPQIGPDGKIYFISNETHVDCIAAPNLAGNACNYIHNAINIGVVSNGITSIHNLYVKPIPSGDTTHISDMDTTLCAPTESLVLHAPAGSDNYFWSNGSTDSTIVIFNAATITLQSVNHCGIRIDTFKIKKVNDEFSLGPDTTYCSSAVVISVPIEGANYLWQDNSTAETYQANNSGTYSVQITDSGCTYADTISIGLINVTQDLGNDTTICDNGQQKITLRANVPDGALAMWSNGSNNDAITVDSGTYWITVAKGICKGSDTIHIQSEVCDCVPFIPTAFTPNKDGKNDVFKAIFQPGCVESGYVLSIYNRWGQMVFTTDDVSLGWDGTYHDMPTDVGT